MGWIEVSKASKLRSRNHWSYSGNTGVCLQMEKGREDIVKCDKKIVNGETGGRSLGRWSYAKWQMDLQDIWVRRCENFWKCQREGMMPKSFKVPALRNLNYLQNLANWKFANSNFQQILGIALFPTSQKDRVMIWCFEWLWNIEILLKQIKYLYYCKLYESFIIWLAHSLFVTKY